MTKIPTCDLHKQTRNAFYEVTVWDIHVCDECRNILRDDEGVPNYCFTRIDTR